MLKRLFIAGAIMLFFVNPAFTRTDILFITQNIVTPQTLQFISSTPRANQTLAKQPASVTLNFSQNLDPTKSSFTLYDPYNNQLETGNATISGSSMSAKFPLLKNGYSGTYRVEWKASCLCTDTTVQNNSFYFSIQ